MSISSNPINIPNKAVGNSWLIWGLAATFFFTDYMARVAPTVMHRDLQFDFGINEVGFATLTAFFYIPYILMQIPVGLTVDRFKIRYLLTSMSILTAVGCCVFGAASGLPMASFARILIGFSAAFAFTSALRLAASWFPASKLGMLAGLTQAMGMLGASSGQAPLSFLVGSVGWRNSMYVIAAIFIVLAFLMYIYIQDRPFSNKSSSKKESLPKYNIWQSLRAVLSSKQTWINALYAGFLYGPSTVIGESIGPAYLEYGRGFSAHSAAFAVGLIFIGWVFGGPLAGFVSDKIGLRKPCMIASALCGFILTSIFVFYPNMNIGLTYTLLFVFGLTNSGVAISYAVATELHDRRVIGTAIAVTNMLSIMIGALLQPLVGYLIDSVANGRGYHVESLLFSDFQHGLRILPVSSLIALILALMVKETYCKPIIKGNG
ncbi:MAG: MFS transporter [Legionellaceae bacterium]|nr:MFS transporter [Legionellaceae bacterium]